MSLDVSTNTGTMWVVSSVTVIVLAVLMGVLQWLVPGDIRYEQNDIELHCVHDDQCERPGDHKLIAETQNTFSNLAYLFFGICVLVRAGRHGAPMRSRPGVVLFGASLVFLALCSAYYHATLNHDSTWTAMKALRAFVDPQNHLQCAPPATPPHSGLPQLLDIVGVYAALIALFLYGLESVFKKEFGEASAGQTVSAVIFGIGLPVAALVFFTFFHGDSGQGGAGAGLLFALLLAIPAGFLFARLAAGAGENASAWVMWGVWLFGVAAVVAVAYWIKPDLDWDSNYVFGVMMAMLIAVLGANWSFSANAVPWTEFAVLGIVFMLGIGPRLLDGYGVDGPTVFRKDLCGPNAILQAHALWHVLSAIALALTFDMSEKSRPVYDSAPCTVLLPQSGELGDEFAKPTGQQGVGVIVLKAVLSAVSLSFLIVVLANHDHSPLGFVVGGLAVVLSVLLWLRPVFG